MLGELFDPKAEFSIREHCRPHWSQTGAIVFVTFRTRDSIPREVLDRWEREKRDWLSRRDLNPLQQHWSVILPTLNQTLREQFKIEFNRTREDFLDGCHGRCLLKSPHLSKIVADSLMYFDGQRYRMGDFIVMPNHVHLLAAFESAQTLKEQCDSWMHFTAYSINQAIGESGKFWQEEPFDHLVRSPEQYDYLRDYISKNPDKARLRPGEYRYRCLSC